MLFPTIVKSIRPPFLLLTLVCIALSSSIALSSGVVINKPLMWIVLLAALFAHIAVNTLNEYQDFISGLDFNTIRTPFSGGSGALPAYPQAAKAVLWISVASMVLTAILGWYLLLLQGALLLIPGICGLLLIVLYTNWINRIPWLCLIAPGTGFGFFMVLGGYLALTGEVDARAFVLSLVPFFVVNNLLLLNQYPDIAADKAVGRNHFPIRFGIDISNKIYLIFVIASMLVIGYGVIMQYLSSLAWLSLFPASLGVFAYFGARKHKHSIGQYPHFLAANVGAALLTPATLAASIYFSM